MGYCPRYANSCCVPKSLGGWVERRKGIFHQVYITSSLFLFSHNQIVSLSIIYCPSTCLAGSDEKNAVTEENGAAAGAGRVLYCFLFFWMPLHWELLPESAQDKSWRFIIVLCAPALYAPLVSLSYLENDLSYNLQFLLPNSRTYIGIVWVWVWSSCAGI